MSRLDSVIRRLQAQRDCLALAARLIARVPGPVLEFGLGNGRTFDHLRSLLPRRELFVFDRHIAAHPDSVPATEHAILGDFRDTVPRAAARINPRAALAHFDIGCGDAATDAAISAYLGPAAAPLMAVGAIVVSDQEMKVPAWSGLALPRGVADGRYFMYRVGASA